MTYMVLLEKLLVEEEIPASGIGKWGIDCKTSEFLLLETKGMTVLFSWSRLENLSDFSIADLTFFKYSLPEYWV